MSLYDPSDPRVKKIVVDYARSKGYEDEDGILDLDVDDLFLERHDSPYRGPEVWITTHLQWRDDVIIYGIDIEHIVNNAILDLLTKE
mgnify:FL=1